MTSLERSASYAEAGRFITNVFLRVQEGVTQRKIRGSTKDGGVHRPHNELKADISGILVEALLEESVGPLEQVRPVLA